MRGVVDQFGVVYCWGQTLVDLNLTDIVQVRVV